jgi:hypothetical protein
LKKKKKKRQIQNLTKRREKKFEKRISDQAKMSGGLVFTRTVTDVDVNVSRPATVRYKAADGHHPCWEQRKPQPPHPEKEDKKLVE